MMESRESQHNNIQARIEQLRRRKMEQTHEKWEIIGEMNHDDWGLILPPPENRKVVRTISGSGVPIVDVILEGISIESNHPSGGFFGPKAVGKAYRTLLENHPVYVDANASLAGATMVNFLSYRKIHWNPDFDFSWLHERQRRYRLHSGIGGAQHFCPDLQIGLSLGWGGLLNKIDHYRARNYPHGVDFYSGLADVIFGMQNWIYRHAEQARLEASREIDPILRKNLQEIAEINDRLVTKPPVTFREACQWMLWYLVSARMYNGSGALGRLDSILFPYYQQDIERGILTEEEAIFHIACLLLRDTAYLQLGGPDSTGQDVTNPVSYLVLEAAHWLKIPTNIGVAVGKCTDPNLLKRGVEILFADKTGTPKFLGIDQTISGFARNGYPVELSRERAYSGCHWAAIPGREYTMNDMVKVNLAAVYQEAWRQIACAPEVASVEALWDEFCVHLQYAVDTIAEGLDFHLRHMQDVFPELVLDLLCDGPIEHGLDASAGGVDYYNMCVDAAGLATVADSFSAIETWVGVDKTISWKDIFQLIENDWEGPNGERIRLMMKSAPHFGHGGTIADKYAECIAQEFTKAVKSKPTPDGYNMIPGLFSWASMISMGKEIGATPNGRKSGDPISHGANPDPGFRRDGAVTALATAVAAVQPGYGNSAPMQLDLDPGIGKDAESLGKIEALIQGHFQLGGTQINLNVLDKQKILEAHQDPQEYPDLIVRVTGFSAYFSSLSPEFRKLVVDRIIAGN